MDKAMCVYYNVVIPIFIRKKGSDTMEWIISGYCRGQDQARSVLLERDDAWYCDCDYPDCAYTAACPVAKEIEEKKQEASL